MATMEDLYDDEFTPAPTTSSPSTTTSPPRQRRIPSPKKAKRGRSQPKRKKKGTSRERIDSLPRSRLRMNRTPASAEFKNFAKMLVGASRVPPATGNEDANLNDGQMLISTSPDDEIVLEPGSRTVTEGEVRDSVGSERQGWVEAAQKEYQESFIDMSAIRISTASDLAAIGGSHRALPMKLVWVQKTDKKNVAPSYVEISKNEIPHSRSGRRRQKPPQ